MINSEKLRILVIEDSRDIAENIADFFEPLGHILDFASEGIGGLHLALTGSYDIIILDIMMPGMDGLTLCRKLRENADTYTPVLMLTARDTLEDKVTGFETGADDYLVKPFALQELAVRINALIRIGKSRTNTKKICVGDLSLDTGTLSVMRDGKLVELNKICLSILKLLMKASPNVVPRQEMEHALWGDFPPGSDALRSHMYTLRRLLDKPFNKKLIHTVHGVGFKIEDSDE